MRIVIIGAGKIGVTLTEQLAHEGHDITVIDSRPEALADIGNRLDIMTVEGNGISIETQTEAGVPEADLVIAVMSTDEQNLLSCLIAKKLGVGNTIARVRNPEYTSALQLVKEDLGLSMALNPELASASEIARILRTPSAIKIDTFSGGRVELYKVDIPQCSPLAGLRLVDLGRMYAGVAHPVERHLAKVEVASSSLVTRSKPRSSERGFLYVSHAGEAERSIISGVRLQSIP